MKKLTWIAMLILIISCSKQNPEIKLPALFSDNMVMQQEAQVNVWGWSKAGAEITVEASWGATATTKAGTDGKWMTSIETPSFGGPFNVSVKSGAETKTITNVMIGEVWLCSGQSNMEMPMKGWPPRDTIWGHETEIANSGNYNIRMFTVTKSVAIKPTSDCIGSWEVSSPENTGNFSATAWYFGKKISSELGVPVGLIHSSWGGTPAEAWTSIDNVETVDGYTNIRQKLEDAADDYEKFEEYITKMDFIPFTTLPKERPYENLNLNDSAFVATSLNISTWRTMNIPSLWEADGLPGYDGIVWLERDFEYNDDVYPEGLELYIGAVDDMDATYLNGVKLGSMEYDGVYNIERKYPIPQGLLKKGNNRVAVKVTDTGGGGGIFGPSAPAVVKGENRLVELGGEWKYMPCAVFYKGKVVIYGEGEKSYDSAPHVEFAIDQNAPTSLYNGMIAPLVPYTMKGAIWYQGEANVGRGKQYETLFPTMITNWRKDWDQGNFPFYFVQIAPYNYGVDANESTAALRDAQFKTLSLENTGMVVTMDIGNPGNIHPGNKKDVGERLALWALAKDYNQEGVVCSGPLYKSASFNKNTVEIEFDYAESGLVLNSSDSFFEIAGTDGEFYSAKAKTEGSKIVVSSPKVKDAKQVRYGWADDCEPNLFNAEGLPASPFKAIAE